MLVLGIESSCDETAAALVENGRRILSNVIASQHELHAPHGGVVPELASRRHVENIPYVIREALDVAGMELKDVDVIAVTRGPGLIGALLVGLSTAKAVAWAEGKPLVPVHHLHGHMMAACLNHETSYPQLCLLVSGGHTAIYRVDSPLSIKELASTRDDAAGEAFDKVAKMLGLGFPGGPALEEAARGGDDTAHKFPTPRVKGAPLDFSFSGLKTAVRVLLTKDDKPAVRDIAASFQKCVGDILVSKAMDAARQYGLTEIIAAGGVARNSYFRTKMKQEADRAGFDVYFPDPVLCTDNAAMIASAGYFLYENDPQNPAFRDFLRLDAVANLPIARMGSSD